MIQRKINHIYRTKEIQSSIMKRSIDNLSDFMNCISDIENGYAVIWFFSGIKTIPVKNGALDENLELDDSLKNIVKTRIFNEDKEWHIWRTNAGIKARLRKDNNDNGDKIEVIDAESPLKSVIAKPLTFMGFSGSKIKLIIRNYIGYSTNQAGYTDMRFVNFKN